MQCADQLPQPATPPGGIWFARVADGARGGRARARRRAPALAARRGPAADLLPSEEVERAGVALAGRAPPWSKPSDARDRVPNSECSPPPHAGRSPLAAARGLPSGFLRSPRSLGLSDGSFWIAVIRTLDQNGLCLFSIPRDFH